MLIRLIYLLMVRLFCWPAGSGCCPAAATPPGLSTAFDPVTLYSRDPDRRPDINGKVGDVRVSIATLDDMRVLNDGFALRAGHLCVDDDQRPRLAYLAMFLNTVIVEAHLARGMSIDDFAPKTPSSSKNGLDAEYSAIGRVARRIWAAWRKCGREKVDGASPRAQQLTKLTQHAD